MLQYTAGPPVSSPAPRRGPRRRWRVVAVAGLVFLLVAALATGGGYWFLARSLPQVEGELRVAGLGAPLTVYRDRWGVPHIVASSRRDLYFAQGFVTAQDRLFQMDLSRRAAAGRLSEIFGEPLLDTDRFFRNLTLRRAAEASLPAYPTDIREILQAYADGVNAFIDQAVAGAKLPPEFGLIGYRPEPWTPIDSISIGKFMAFDLGGNWRDEVWRYQLALRVGEAKMKELLPLYPKDGPTIVGELREKGLDAGGLLAMLPPPDDGIGSNNWVLAGGRTRSGKPVLANDPHLGIRGPSIWYQTRLELPSEQMNVTGTTFPGAPGVVVGHNAQIAWGVTNLGPDVQDLYVELPNPANPREFLYNGRYEPARATYPEEIRVKGRKEPALHTVVVSRHGPIVSPVAGSQEDRPQAALALRWTALDPTAELAAVIGFNRARNWQEFREALRLFAVPAQNFVFASVDGTIAYRGNGQIPIRKRGDGLLPAPGWTDEYEWTGFIPFERLPEAVNPPEGFIATANNKVVGDSYPYFLTHSWATPYREQRIKEVLAGAKGWGVDEMRRLQVDAMNLQARLLLPHLLPAAERGLGGLGGGTAAEQAALKTLQAWDRVDGQNSEGAAIWHVWYRKFLAELYRGQMGPDLFERMPSVPLVTDRLIVEASEGKAASWFGERGLPGVAAQSLRAAVAELGRDLGGDLQAWRWGRLHRIRFRHPLGRVRPLDLLFDVGPFPMDGGDETVGRAHFTHAAPSFEVTNAAPWRQVVDLADPAAGGWGVVAPGQSGHPLSRHYADQAGGWVSGELYPQLFTEAALRDARKLVLRPGG